MAMGLSEAASATGVNRSTLFRAYKSGRMSATRTDTGRSRSTRPSFSASFLRLRRNRAHRGRCITPHRPTQQTIMRCAPAR